MTARFRNRAHAGRVLAETLTRYADRGDTVVLALARGGVPVGFEVAVALGAPLDVFLVRKLGVPGHEELAMGAIASGGVRVIDAETVAALGIVPETIDAVAAAEQRELERRERLYRGGRAALRIAGRTVLLVDDGLATGASMHAAAIAVRRQHPRQLIAAVPTGAADACRQLADAVDCVVCATTPQPFFAVGLWYDDFAQTADEQVRDLLDRAALQREMAQWT